MLIHGEAPNPRHSQIMGEVVPGDGKFLDQLVLLPQLGPQVLLHLSPTLDLPLKDLDPNPVNGSLPGPGLFNLLDVVVEVVSRHVADSSDCFESGSI